MSFACKKVEIVNAYRELTINNRHLTSRNLNFNYLVLLSWNFTVISCSNFFNCVDKRPYLMFKITVGRTSLAYQFELPSVLAERQWFSISFQVEHNNVQVSFDWYYCLHLFWCLMYMAELNELKLENMKTGWKTAHFPAVSFS